MTLPFTCICCGYITSKKSSMRDHLYKKKTPCPKSQRDIDLTEEIKDYILQNRVYHIPTPPPPPPVVQQNINNNTINQQINNYNQINNFVSSMDLETKLEKFMNHKNIQITDFEDGIEERFSNHVDKLEGNKVNNYQLDLQSLMEVFDDVTTIKDNVENFNIYYDEIPNKLNIFCNGKWKSFLLDVGIKKMIDIIQGYYLDAYECYMIRKLHTTTSSHIKDRIEEYYKFLACFGVWPFAHCRSNGEILSGEEDACFDLSDTWYNVYNRVKDRITMTECNRIRKQVREIVKRNTKSNIMDLNKMIMDMLHVDQDFKNTIIDKL